MDKSLLLNRDRLSKAFTAFDIDMNGGISLAEFNSMLGPGP